MSFRGNIGIGRFRLILVCLANGPIPLVFAVFYIPSYKEFVTTTEFGLYASEAYAALEAD